MAKQTFEQAVEKNREKLTQFTPIVLRVHGEHHPEMNEVNNLFNQINEKLEDSEPTLDSEFKKLREVTNNYQIPTDVCESYEAVYDMLAEWDQAYFA